MECGKNEEVQGSRIMKVGGGLFVSSFVGSYNSCFQNGVCVGH
jgi:hypothetical protein